MAAEFSMRRAATLGKSGVVRWRRNGSRSVVRELGFGIDIGELFVVRPQVHLLISGAIADGGFRLVVRLHTRRQQPMGQTRQPPRTSGAKPGLRWRSRWVPEDGGGCSGRRRRRASADTLAHADAQSCRDEDKRDDEGGPCDVEGPAGHGDTKGGSAVSIAQLSEVLEVG